ncbi:MAG: DNA polymerase III subunit beta [Bacilli bacterium]
MKLKINRKILLESLNCVSKAISNRNIIPILNGIYFELNSKGLTLVATDNDITIKGFIGKEDILEIVEVGKTVLYGRFLVDILRKLNNEIISFENIDGNKVVVSTNNSKYNLNCYDVNDFPDVNIEIGENPIKINTTDFKKVIYNTLFATSTQESRPILTGVNMKIQGKYLECTATDSYRLSKMFITLDKEREENVNVIIPGKNLTELLKILEDDTEELDVNIYTNKIIFKYKSFLFQSSLLNGTYPNTNNLIPTDFLITLELDFNEFYSVIDRASLLSLSKEKNNIQLEIKNKNLIITSVCEEIGKIEEKIFIENINNYSIQISFNARYMLDALKQFNTKNICINMNGEIKPIIINSEEKESLTELILPIKTF